jgi:hypothetical protein
LPVFLVIITVRVCPESFFKTIEAFVLSFFGGMVSSKGTPFPLKIIVSVIPITWSKIIGESRVILVPLLGGISRV